MQSQDIGLPELHALLRYDPATGHFTWLVNRGRNAKPGQIAGTLSTHGYIQIRISNRSYLAHRLAWFYVRRTWPPEEVDHKDGCLTNNALDNLRSVSREMNAQNLHIARATNKTSGLLGVSRHSQGRWIASIGVNRRIKYLGLFDTPEAAHEAYLQAKRSLHTGCLI